MDPRVSSNKEIYSKMANFNESKLSKVKSQDNLFKLRSDLLNIIKAMKNDKTLTLKEKEFYASRFNIILDRIDSQADEIYKVSKNRFQANAKIIKDYKPPKE